MIGLLLAFLTIAVHAATAWRYGYNFDELYFIACSRHLAWGYVDQPPLVALAAALASPVHYELLALRALPILAAGATVFIAVAIAKELGAGRYGQALCGICVGFMPAALAWGNLLATSSFDGLSWTLVAWIVLRILRDPRSRALWVGLSFAIAFGLYGKYSMALYVAALLAGLLLTPQRRVLRTPWAAVCALLTALLVLPNFLWQAQHGYPFLQVIADDARHRIVLQTGLRFESVHIGTNALLYLAEQALYTNPAAVAVWMTGVMLPFFSKRFANLRFMSIASILLVVAAIALEAKGYYTAGMYPVLFAIGSAGIERAALWVRITVPAAIGAIVLAVLPFTVGLLPIETFIAYTQALRMTGTPPHLIDPIFAEEFGWRRVTRDVASVYDAIAQPVRANTAVFADTYAYAGAIDLFGPQYGLPPAISGKDTYWLWGTHGYDGSSIIAVGASRSYVFQQDYRTCRLVKLSTEPLKWVVEGPTPIYLCSGPKIPFGEIWRQLRWYGA